MKNLITWNVNGLRAAIGKGFMDFVKEMSPDAMCIQETKMQKGQADVDIDGYTAYFNDAERKGYSGTAIWCKDSLGIDASAVSYDIDAAGHDTEGRSVTIDYGNFYLVCEYTPNAQNELARIDYRMEWEDARRAYIKKLDAIKPVILCGDLNVARTEIDLKNPKTNRGNAGFSDEERGKIEEFLSSGFTDAFRYKYPDLEGAYTWWSYRFNARKNNAGWRIDYFLVSDRIADKIQDVIIHNEVFGSDHCPVQLIIDL
ncbi:MAG: exodeoxyribonuclease III [Clostridiales Family XIII bacterium]|jgi:exodeoxyribonuclease-3|nr:exodeoxyribonuclease III [Clostridiales Family XIII bacterium]